MGLCGNLTLFFVQSGVLFSNYSMSAGWIWVGYNHFQKERGS